MAVGKTVETNKAALASDINKMAGWGLFAARPATGDVLAGSFYMSTDTNVLYQEQNGSWAAILQIKTLNPANEIVEAGYYAATTLSAVDADLAVGNIKVGVNIFGKVGTLVGSLTEPIWEASGQVATGTDEDVGDAHTFPNGITEIPASAVKVLALLKGLEASNHHRYQIVYNGVQRAEGAYSASLKWLGNGVGIAADLVFSTWNPTSFSDFIGYHGAMGGWYVE